MKYKEKTENRVENKTFRDYVEYFTEVSGSTANICYTSLTHDEVSKKTLKEITVNSICAKFITEEWTLIITPFNDGGIEIYKIEASKSKGGIGTKLMNMVLDAADELGVSVNLVPVPFTNRYGIEGINKYKLISWYVSFGFKANKLSQYLKYSN